MTTHKPLVGKREWGGGKEQRQCPRAALTWSRCGPAARCGAWRSRSWSALSSAFPASAPARSTDTSKAQSSRHSTGHGALTQGHIFMGFTLTRRKTTDDRSDAGTCKIKLQTYCNPVVTCLCDLNHNYEPHFEYWTLNILWRYSKPSGHNPEEQALGWPCWGSLD